MPLLVAFAVILLVVAGRHGQEMAFQGAGGLRCQGKSGKMSSPPQHLDSIFPSLDQ